MIDVGSTSTIATDDIVQDILKLLRDEGVCYTGEEKEAKVMAELMVLITRRDEKLFTYAYKLGRASV